MARVTFRVPIRLIASFMTSRLEQALADLGMASPGAQAPRECWVFIVGAHGVGK